MSLQRDSATLYSGDHLLNLEGEIDLAQRPRMAGDIELLLQRDAWLIIDLSAVTFIECTGLGTLIWARARAEDLGGQLELVGPCAALSRILTLTSLDDILRLHPDVPAAEAALAGTPAHHSPLRALR